MAVPIRMPMPGQMTEECTVLQWFKAEGDTISKGDPLFEIETDKSNMEIEAFDEGTLLRIDVPEGATVPVESIVEGIRHGVRKVNIDTDIRLAMTGAMRRAMAKDPGEFDPRKFLKDAMAAARDLCKARFEAFGCAGQAARIRPLPLEKMAVQYA